MIRRQVKNTFAKFALPLLRKRGGMLPKVFFYHGVEEKIIDKQVQTMHIPLALFEAQMKYLKKYYNVISVEEYEHQLKNGFSGKEVVLTFDDGYQNNLTVAAPVLKNYGLPFSVYPSMAYVGTNERCPTFILRAVIWNSRLTSIDLPSLKLKSEFTRPQIKEEIYGKLSQLIKYSDWDKTRMICDELINNLPEGEWKAVCDRFESDKILNWEQLKALADYNCEIGSHGMEHGLLHSGQSETFIKRQVQTSFELINQHIPGCRYYVYPNGGKKDVSSMAMQQVEQTGFTLAFSSVSSGNMANRYFLPRTGDVLNITDFKLKLAR